MSACGLAWCRVVVRVVLGWCGWVVGAVMRRLRWGWWLLGCIAGARSGAVVGG